MNQKTLKYRLSAIISLFRLIHLWVN